ncbi:hypothetical protein C0J52_03709 [Blattella germanica]|nr:hypothetical protein C0J52_03709 [Blattella germanica]
MVMKCPSGSNSLMSKRCEASKDSDLKYHYTMDVPVLSNRSGIWYRNIYCAICNGEDGQLAHINYSIFCQYNYSKEQVIWTKDLALEVVGNGEYSEPVTWQYRNGEVRICSLNAKPVSDVPMKFQRMCGIKSQVSRGMKAVASWKIPIDSCLSNWTNDDTAKKCKAYSLYSKQKSIVTIGNSANDIVLPQVYKNPHCAICNEVPVENITCYIPSSGEDKTRKGVSLEIVMNFMESEQDIEEIR